MPTRCRRRKCCSCHQLYDPDPRSRYHQAYCPKPECRKASKAASQRRWRASDKGRDYFQGPANRQRVKAWRAAHPGYARKQPKSSRALQDDCLLQAIVPPEDKLSLGHRALQEMIITQNLLLTGLIVTLTGGALQDDIAPAIDRLIRLGQQVQSPLAPRGAGPATGGQPHGGIQTSAVQGAIAASPPAVQLDRPSPGP